MRASAVVAVAVGVTVLVVAACAGDEPGGGSGTDDPVVLGPQPDAGTGGSGGGGAVVDAGTSVPDAGTPPPDAGTGIDPACAEPPSEAVAATLPSTPGWKFYGKESGGPDNVYSVSADDAGNLWVAGGRQGLYVLPTGESTFRRFTHADGLGGYIDPVCGPRGYSVIAVRGGAAGVVYVGYEGLFGGKEDDDPRYMVTSGDADKVVFDGAHVKVERHFDISTPPGKSSHYPMGRDKIRSVYRIELDRQNGRVWFGGNHGVALWNGKEVEEHEHAAINGYDESGGCTILSGDWFGLSLNVNGDPWAGGAHRMLRINYSTAKHLEYTGSKGPPIVDVWPDAVDDPGACVKLADRVDDNISDLVALGDGSAWVGSVVNGLAHVQPDGTVSTTTRSYGSQSIDPAVTALERDPKTGALWVGHMWTGVSVRDGGWRWLYADTFGRDLVNLRVNDLQSDWFDGERRMLVAFLGDPASAATRPGRPRKAGAIGVYVGD